MNFRHVIKARVSYFHYFCKLWQNKVLSFFYIFGVLDSAFLLKNHLSWLGFQQFLLDCNI